MTNEAYVKSVVRLIDGCDDTTGWTALGNDTLNLALAPEHVTGAYSLEFDKVNGAANTVFAGIQKTISPAIQLGKRSADQVLNPRDIIRVCYYLSSLTNVAYMFIRLGTSSSHYNEWRVADTDLVAGEFDAVDIFLKSTTFAAYTGNGWDPNAITYVAMGVAFDAETNTLAGIKFDHLTYHSSLRVDQVEVNLDLGDVTIPATVDATVSSLVAGAKTNSTSTAQEASRVIKASAGTLFGLTVHNAKASAQFFQLHDATSAPADTAVPVLTVEIPANTTRTLDFGIYGRTFATGIVACNSSTGPTKTIGSADCLFDAQYT